MLTEIILAIIIIACLIVNCVVGVIVLIALHKLERRSK